jgi:hypothetical protein
MSVTPVPVSPQPSPQPKPKKPKKKKILDLKGYLLKQNPNTIAVERWQKRWFSVTGTVSL